MHTHTHSNSRLWVGSDEATDPLHHRSPDCIITVPLSSDRCGLSQNCLHCLHVWTCIIAQASDFHCLIIIIVVAAFSCWSHVPSVQCFTLHISVEYISLLHCCILQTAKEEFLAEWRTCFFTVTINTLNLESYAKLADFSRSAAALFHFFLKWWRSFIYRNKVKWKSKSKHSYHLIRSELA